MSFGEDWLNWTIFIFIIVTIITIVIKMFIEYPGLTGLKCVYKDELEDFMDDDDVEIGLEDDKAMKILKKSKVQKIKETAQNERCKTDENPVKKNENDFKVEEVSVMSEEETDKENQNTAQMKKKVSFDMKSGKLLKTKVATIEHSKPGSSSPFISSRHVYRQS